MKAWILSDLHLEPSVETLDESAIPEADVCICAGNVSSAGMAAGLRLLGRSLCARMPVVFVPGTHDYKGRSIPEVKADALAEASRFPGLHLLDERTLILRGIAFVGATLWSDLCLFGDRREAIEQARRSRDYIEIKTSGKPDRKRFSPQQAIRLHERARGFIEDQLSRLEGMTTVVVTHHAPSLRSMPERYMNDPLAPTLASSLEGLIMERQPDLWVHGGVSGERSYSIGCTTVVANPRGFGRLPYGHSIAKSSLASELVIDVGGRFSSGPLSCSENESRLDAFATDARSLVREGVQA